MCYPIYVHFYECTFGFFFSIMTSAVIPAAGSTIARILLAKIPGSFALVPGEVGNGFSMLGGD